MLGHVLFATMFLLIFDRYMLVLVPVGIALLLSGTSTVRPKLAIAMLVGLAAISVVGLRDHLEYNRALWTAVSRARLYGAQDSEIDGGYVVNGWQQYAHPDHAPRDDQGHVVVPWVNVKGTLRYQISNRRDTRWRLLARLPYHRWLGRSGAIYVQEQTREGG